MRLYVDDGQLRASDTLLPGTGNAERLIFSWFRAIPNDSCPTEGDIALAFDVRYLQPLLYFLARTIHAATVVEIGTADGSTTIPLLCAVSEMSDGRVYSIDPDPCVKGHDVVIRSGLVASWTFCHGTSRQFFASGRAPAAIDFAFIDGDHTAEGVAYDAVEVLTRLVPGGIAVFHEWGDAPPYQEISELVRKTEPDTSQSAAYGTHRALYEVLPQFDVDVMPLDFGACGKGRSPEWTEAPAVMVRRRKAIDFRLRSENT